MSRWYYDVLAVALAALWQWATVTANYNGNWTALFCTGAMPAPPAIATAESIYLFPNTYGFDGQIYHYIAHDPFMRSGMKDYIHSPALRYRRILVPWLAYGLALGRSEWIDRAYLIVCLMGVGLGVYWSCRFVQTVKLPAAWGLAFLAIPAIPITVDRLVLDGTLAALTAALLCYGRAPSWKLFLVLVCAALTRETGFLLVLACCANFAWRRELRAAGIFLLSGVPALAWYAYVHSRSPEVPYGASLIPFSAILPAVLNPWKYPPEVPFVAAVHVADYVALAGVLLGFGLAFLWFVRAPHSPLRIAAMLFAAMGIVLQRGDHWNNVYDYGRVYSPLFVCLAATAAERRKPWLLAPIAMMLPRLAIQLTPQVLGILRWL